MKRRLLVFFSLGFLTACAQAPSPSTVPTGQANGLTAVHAVSKTIVQPTIRVGLVSDQTSVTFPRIDGGYYLITDKGTWTLRRGFTDTAPLRETAQHYAVQVSALSEKASADALAAKVHTATQQPTEVIFNAAAGLYRVLAGDFPDSRAAGIFRDDLLNGDYPRDVMVVRHPTDQPFPHQHQIVDDEGQRTTLTGDSLLVMPITGETVTIDGKPYRGAASVFLNDRGLFNVINELNLEDYLRGVVPGEMGPKVFDELEALKAQAVAARTYAVRNLGQFRAEGYDICPGPTCQVYKGFSGEDPMTDQAVHDTAGLIMTYQGKPIDALFTSTCGGETSDVGTMFPGRSDPYLKHVRCVELQMTAIPGRRDSDMLDQTQFDSQLFGAIAHILPPPGPLALQDLANAVALTYQLIGVSSAPAPLPASTRRGDVLRYLSSVFHAAEYSNALVLPEDIKYYFPETDITKSPATYQAAAFLIKYGFLPTQSIDGTDLNGPISADEVFGILGSWLRKHAAIIDVHGKIGVVNGRSVTLRGDGQSQTFTLPPMTPAFRKLGDRYQEYKVLPVMIGDRAIVEVNARGIPVAVVVEANTSGAAFDRTSNYAEWTRTYRADDLANSINRRTPIRQLLDLRPLAVDVAHRVAELQVTAEGGRTFVLRGLPIRWSLNLPDNLFVIEKTSDPDGVDRYTFYGKGWGHGVGMCQVGAYGMALQGKTFDKILEWYYTGIDIVPMNQAVTSGVRRQASGVRRDGI